MFRRKKSGSARAEKTPPEDALDAADDASLWSDDSMTPERGTLTHGAVRGLPGGGSSGDASPSSRSVLSVDSAASTPSRARSVSTDRWRRDALETLSARMLDEETREARELAAAEARHREEQDRKRAGVLASLPSTLASFRRRRSKTPSVARASGDGAEGHLTADFGFETDDFDDTETPRRFPTGLSRVGVHPCEKKRAAGEEPSRRVANVARVALAVLPARGRPREGTEGTLEALRRDGFEILETSVDFAYERSDAEHDDTNRMVSLSKMLECGAVVNGLDAVDAQTWKNFRAARAAGVLVFNYDMPGLYIELDAHVDVTCAVSKFVPPYSVNLEERCDMKEDGYREIAIHVVSGPDHDAERVAMRDVVLPRLVERCRARRIRPKYVDLRSDAAGCGPGHALRVADELSRGAAVHVVLVSGKHEPELEGDKRVKAFVDKVPRGAEREKFEWLSRAPSDYSRSEMTVAHVLRLAQTPKWLEAEEAREREQGEEKENANDDAGSKSSSKSRRSFASRASGTSDAKSKASRGSRASRGSKASKASEPLSASAASVREVSGGARADAVAISRAAPSSAAARRAALKTEQHVLAYARGASFFQDVPFSDMDEFLATDPYERERVASFLSTLYAHPNVSVRVYDCVYAPGSKVPGGGAFVTGVPAHAADLDAFAESVLEDVWSRVSYEFAPNPVKDIVAWHERQPEFALQNALPVYFNRGVPEHTITRCVKLGRPKVICLSGLEGRGVTSVMQRCARECRRSFGNLDGHARDEVVVLSVFPKVGGAPLTPTQVFTRLTAQLAAARRERGAGAFGDAASGFEPVPETLNGARAAFLDAVRATIGPTRRVAVFIDDATAVENPLGLAWMVHEREIPTGCQVICGARARDEKLARKLVSENFSRKNKTHVLLTEEGIATHAPDRLLRAQIAGLAACLFDSVARPLTLRPMSYAERKLYVAKHLKSVFAELDEASVSAVLASPSLAHVPYARCLVELLLTMDTDNVDVTRLMEKKSDSRVPQDHRGMLLAKLESLERAFPKPTLALTLPAVALGRGALTAEDIAALVAVTLTEEEEAYLDAFIVPAFMHAARDFIAGPFEGTFGAASDLAADVVLERYAPDEPARRAAFRMLAEYYGDLDALASSDDEGTKGSFDAADRDGRLAIDALAREMALDASAADGDAEDAESRRRLAREKARANARRRPSPGRGLLRRFFALSPNALARDGDGAFAHASAFQEHHLVCDSLFLLPYYLTKARRFGELCALFRDFSFLQAKLCLGEGAALVADFDRALRFPRPPWLEEWDGGDARLGSREYFAAKRVAEKALRHACVLDLPQYDRAAFQKWLGDAFGDSSSAHGDVVAFRHLVWRNLRSLSKRPHALLQVAMNAPGDAEPGAAAEDIVRRLAPPPERDANEGDESSARAAYRFADAAPGEAFLLLWSNRPDEAVFAEFRDAAIHAEPVTCALWIDDAAFVTAGEDGLVAVWSAQTGECAARLRGHERAVTSVVVVPGGAGAGAAENGESGETETAGAVSEHGVRVVTSSLDGTVRVWHVEGELGRSCDVLVHDAAGRTAVNALALAPDAGELLSVGDDGVAVCWDVLCRGPPRRVRATQTSHAGPCTSVACSPDGSVFVTGGADKTLQVWSSLDDVADETSDARTVLSSSSASAAARWRRRAEGKEDVRSIRSFASRASGNSKGAPEQVLRLIGHLAEVTCVAFGRDAFGAPHVASGSLDHSVMLWNAETGVHVGILTGHAAPIVDVSYSKDHTLLLSASRDRTTRLWRADTGEVVLALNHGARLGGARLSPDASKLLAGVDTGAVAVWGWLGREGSASMGQSPQRPNLFATGHPLSDDKSCDDSNQSARGDADASTRRARRSRDDGSRRRPNPFAFDGQAHKGAVTCIASFDHTRAFERETDLAVADLEMAAARAPAVTGGADGYVRVVSAGARDAGRVTSSFASNRRGPEGTAVIVHGVAASPDGTRALAACGDGTVVEWDVVTGVERAAFPAHAGAARAAAYGGGALLGAAVSGGDDGVVRLWTVDETSETSDVASDSKNRSSSFRGHAGRVTGIAVGGETSGDVVVSCGVDRAALLWDVRRGVPKASFVGHEGALTSVALGAGDAFDSSGGGLLCTTGSDRAVRFWDARAGNGTNACVRVLNLEAVPVACASCVSQPRWFATCGADGLTVLDARVFREVAHFEGLAPLTALAFHGESKLFAGDADGRLYALDVWKAPPRSWE